MANQLPAIKHVVQLMLENRSFDQMLGFLYTANGNRSPANHPYEGLTGSESNPDDAGREIGVFKIDGNALHPYLMPGADPGEGFFNTNYQLFSTDDPEPDAVPTNRGFVVNFKAAIQSDQAKGFKDTLPGTEPLRNHGHVCAGNGADHVRPGEGFRGLRPLVLLHSDADDSKSYVRSRGDQPGSSRQSRQGFYLPEHFRPAQRKEHRLGDLWLQSRSADATAFHRLPSTPTSAISAISGIFKPGARTARFRPTPFSSRASAPAATVSIPTTMSRSANC